MSDRSNTESRCEIDRHYAKLPYTVTLFRGAHTTQCNLTAKIASKIERKIYSINEKTVNAPRVIVIGQ